MHYRGIYSTNMFYLRVKHGDSKRKTCREKKAEWFAVEIATPITISWHDSEVVRLSFVFFFDLEHCFLSGAISLSFTAMCHKSSHDVHFLNDWLPAFYHENTGQISFLKLNNYMTVELCWLWRVYYLDGIPKHTDHRDCFSLCLGPRM